MSMSVALVTGASRGIGAATALALAGRGYDVAFTYRNKAARANEVAAQIETRGDRPIATKRTYRCYWRLISISI